MLFLKKKKVDMHDKHCLLLVTLIPDNDRLESRINSLKTVSL